MNSIEISVPFDFDGVVANDEAERVYKERGIKEYHEYENQHSSVPMEPGPLGDFFTKISSFQKLETEKKRNDDKYEKILKTAIITARNAPAHERAINTLNSWGVEMDEMFILGGIDKSRILEIMKPHLYFDDQMDNLDKKAVKNTPLVHIPFGVANEEEK